MAKEKVILVPEKNEVKINPKAFAPLIIALVGLIGTFCTSVLGWEPLPFTGEEVAEFISYGVTAVGMIWSWFRNNNVTKKGLQREAVAEQAVPKKVNK